MFINYIKIFFRNAVKHYGYSLSNIVGLSVGMATCLLILSYIAYEFNWNTYNENYDCIYRVQQKAQMKDNELVYTQTGFALAGELKHALPEVEEAVTIAEVWGEYLSSSDDLQFYEEQGYYTGNNIFNTFTFNFIEGSKENALSEPHAIVITEEMAQKYFPGQNPLGKMLKASWNKYLKVTAVVENLPYNLDLRPDYLISLATLKEVNPWKEFDELRNIDAGAYRTYVMLKPNVSAASVDHKIHNFIDRYIPVSRHKLYLKPLSDIHLFPYDTSDLKVALYYLGGIALFVLILGCINFINLLTASSNLRGKEIGIRKVVGAAKLSLVRQFISESLIYSTISMIAAMILSAILLPSFNLLVQRHLEINYFADGKLILLVLGVLLFTGLLSGIYPAFFLSSLKPVDVIKGRFSFGNNRGKDNSKSFFRKGLVTFQFIISITLIIVTVYVVKQVHYMKNKDLGFNKNNLVLCKIFGKHSSGNFETLRNELLGNANIVDASVSFNAPFNGKWGREINWEGAEENEKTLATFNKVGYDYINTYEIEIIKGRNFSKEFPTDETACLINETAVKKFGWVNPIGKKVDGNKYTVIGVVKDFHEFSIHNKIDPSYMVLHSGKLEDEGLYAVRIKPGSRDEVVKYINAEFRAFFPDAIVEIANFDQKVQYGTEDVWEVVEKVFFIFAIIAILIAANGLFGLMSFAAQRRIKEIGIRKVFGAGVPGLYLLISKEFLYIIIISIIIALPAGYYVSVITPGAYKYQLHFSDYFFAVFSMGFTAVAAAFYHTTKAVLSNPVKSLKYE